MLPIRKEAPMRRLSNALPGTPFESAPFFIAPWIFGSRAVGRAAVEFKLRRSAVSHDLDVPPEHFR